MMKILKLIFGLVDPSSIKRDIWHFISDYIIFLDSNLFALLRGLMINALNKKLSIAYVYKGCDFYSFTDINLGRNVIIKKGCRINGPVDIGEDTIIDQGVVLSGPVKIGAGCHVNFRAWVDKHVTLEDRVGIGHSSFLVTFTHEYNDPNWRWGKELTYSPILIRHGNWVGAHVNMLPGVEIGYGSIIGAGSVVTKSIPECSLAAGNPAKVIKKLNRSSTNADSI